MALASTDTSDLNILQALVVTLVRILDGEAAIVSPQTSDVSADNITLLNTVLGDTLTKIDGIVTAS